MDEKKYETKFNTVILGLVNFISNCLPSSFFGKHKTAIECFIDDKPAEPVAYFIKYIYSNDEYRNRLKNMDDDFFIDQTFNEIISDNSEYVKRLFYFKELWISFDDDSKMLVKRSMKGLIKISESYINILYASKAKDTEIKIVNENKYEVKGKIVKKHKEKLIESDSEYDLDSISIGSKKTNKCKSNYETDTISIGSRSNVKNKKTAKN
jgi:hypothetical protein